MFLLDIILLMIMMILLMICVLVSVAFITLMERKVLGYIQLRKGPNKVSIMGILQPFSDAIKLFTKEQVYPVVSNYWMYYISPIVSLFLALLLWILIPYYSTYFMFNLGILFLLSCMSVGVYTIIVSGWSSNSNYALLGGLRAAAQTISYEVSLAILMMTLIFLIESYNLWDLILFQKKNWFLLIFMPLSLVYLTIFLAETHRTPFDFSEGESELVSGFNIEYGSGGFALLFLGEYANILFMSLLFSLMFLGANIYSFIFFLKMGIIVFFFIWARGTLPRYRYDKLMYMAWKSYLPLSLNFMLFMIGLKIYFM